MILTVTLNPAIDRVYFLHSFEVGEVNRPASMTYTAGGKGLNVSRVASILGEAVCATGFLGGYNGQFISQELKRMGIEDSFIQIEGETRICLNMTDQSTGRSTEILEPGPVISQQACEAFLSRFEEQLKRCDVVTISGSMPKGVPADFYCQLVRAARRAGKRILVDTSGDSLARVLQEAPYLVKPNCYEAGKLMGSQIRTASDIKAALRCFMQAGVELPVVSAGKDGAYCEAAGKLYHFTTPDIAVVNTVGSGDSFIAGAAVGLSRGLDTIAVIKLAMACGTANACFAQTGVVSQELVEKYYNQIDVIAIEE